MNKQSSYDKVKTEEKEILTLQARKRAKLQAKFDRNQEAIKRDKESLTAELGLAPHTPYNTIFYHQQQRKGCGGQTCGE